MWPFKKDYAKELDFKFLRNALPLQNQYEYTPDRLWLERHAWVILFVYDELMRARSLYHLLDESVSLGTAFTPPNWTMWKKKLGEHAFPIAMNGDSVDFTYDMGKKVTHRGRIKGELHLVRPSLFWNYLDKRYLNGIEFRRERVKVLVPYTSDKTGPNEVFVQPVKAHMYVGITDYWNRQIDNGFLFSTVKRFNPKRSWVDGQVIDEYFYYSRLEYESNF